MTRVTYALEADTALGSLRFQKKRTRGVQIEECRADRFERRGAAGVHHSAADSKLRQMYYFVLAQCSRG
jgi:hypothetical protein